MRRPLQFSLAHTLAALTAIQPLLAAAAGAFGELVQIVTWAVVLLIAAAAVHLLLESLLAGVLAALLAVADAMPLEVRPPAAGQLRRYD
jgi:hypothetical protein